MKYDHKLHDRNLFNGELKQQFSFNFLDIENDVELLSEYTAVPALIDLSLMMNASFAK